MMDSFSDLKQRKIGVGRTASHDSSMLLPLACDSGHSTTPTMPPRRGIHRTHSYSYARNRHAETTCCKRITICLFITMLACGLYLYPPETLNKIRQELGHDAAVISELQHKVASMEQENTKLSKELQLAEQQARKLEQGGTGDEEQVKELETKVSTLIKQKRAVRDLVQQHSLKKLMERFGPGPHRVEMILEYHADSNVRHDSGGDRIVIELAPEEEMPHTVYWFLEQVDRGLYVGCSFHRNANHVMQVGPVPNFATPHNVNRAMDFRQSGFNHVLFQEYSEKFPHYKYTLGYAGRPGGPDFYISTKNNVQAHGPGGQMGYDDPGEPDPCFAKVVEGFEAVDRLHRSAVQPGNYQRMEHYVNVHSMRMLPRVNEENSAEENVRVEEVHIED